MTKILLIEDEQELLESLTLLLEINGFEVYGAATFAAATERISTGSFDLILSDINLPDGNGLALLELLRLRGDNMPPFVVISAFGDKADIKKGLDAGATAYMVKPLAFRSLLDQIHQFV